MLKLLLRIGAVFGLFVAWTTSSDEAMPHVSEESLEAGHETQDVPSRPVFWVIASAGIFAFLLHFGLTSMFDGLKRHYRLEMNRPAPAEPSLVAERQGPPPPRLQANPAADLKAYQLREAQLLDSYGWSDPKTRTARIPIQRAMEILSNGHP
jgi:hypothetical protein